MKLACTSYRNLFSIIGLLLFNLNLHAQIENNLKINNNVNCNSNGFLAITSNGSTDYVYELLVQGNNVLINGVYSGTSMKMGLGYSNNLNGGFFNPTVYSSEILSNSYTTPTYLDSAGWIISNFTDSLITYECGGWQNKLYYMIYNSNINRIKEIAAFDGSTFHSIYQTPINVSSAVADIAVDNNGNIWFFTLDDSLPFFANKLNVIDSTGLLLAQYNTWFDITSAYGLCIIGDTLYIGFGWLNSIFSNSLVSVSVVGNIAVLSNSIDLSSIPFFQNLNDLASCNPGVPVGFKDYRTKATGRIKAYPNPASESITIAQIPNEAKELVMLNGLGAMVYNTELQHQNQLNLEVSQFPPGMYAVCVYTPTEVYMVKWIKSE